MEFILGLIIVVVIFLIANLVFRGITSGAKATYDAATGKDSFKGSFKTGFVGMGDFEIRIIRATRSSEGFEFEVFEIQAKGIIPVPNDNTDCSIFIHIFDTTNGNSLPVVSTLDDFQESDSRSYQALIHLGPVRVDSGYPNWVPIGAAIIDCLMLPYSGERELMFQACVVPTNNPPLFQQGFREGERGQIFAVGKSKTKLDFKYRGYLDEVQNRQEIEDLSIQLAFYIASLDGSLVAEEGQVIQEWTKGIIEGFAEGSQEHHKQRLNNVIRKAFENAKNGSLEPVSIIARINEIATVQEKYEAIELCLDVMKADHKADQAEILALDDIAKKMSVNPERFRALQDRRLAEVETIELTDDSLAQILGITQGMDKDTIRKHLASEYRKWNSRVSSSDEKVKDRAQEMILLIGAARKRYLSEEINPQIQ